MATVLEIIVDRVELVDADALLLPDAAHRRLPTDARERVHWKQ